MDHNPEIICWNVRGLNNPAKRKVVREFITSIRVNLACLQETKLDVIDQYLVLQCLGPSFDGFAYLSAMETRGGILLAWDTTTLFIDNVQLDPNFITGMVHLKEGGTWWTSVVYRPQGDDLKLSSWKTYLHAGWLARENG